MLLSVHETIVVTCPIVGPLGSHNGQSPSSSKQLSIPLNAVFAVMILSICLGGQRCTQGT